MPNDEGFRQLRADVAFWKHLRYKGAYGPSTPLLDEAIKRGEEIIVGYYRVLWRRPLLDEATTAHFDAWLTGHVDPRDIQRVRTLILALVTAHPTLITDHSWTEMLHIAEYQETMK